MNMSLGLSLQGALRQGPAGGVQELRRAAASRNRQERRRAAASSDSRESRGNGRVASP
jgi:hypothetical protein